MKRNFDFRKFFWEPGKILGVRVYGRMGVWALLLCPIQLFSQTKDAGLWTSANLEKKITQKFSANFSGELRFNENISELGTYFADPGMSYTLFSNLKIAAHYRFSCQRRVEGTYSGRHRYYFDIAYRCKFWKMAAQARYRFQTQYTDLLTSEDGKIPGYTNRYKFTLRYVPDKPYKPFLAAEFFENLDGYYLEKIRWFSGVEYAFNKRNSMELFYLIQQEVQVREPVTDFIFGAGYNYVF